MKYLADISQFESLTSNNNQSVVFNGWMFSKEEQEKPVEKQKLQSKPKQRYEMDATEILSAFLDMHKAISHMKNESENFLQFLRRLDAIEDVKAIRGYKKFSESQLKRLVNDRKSFTRMAQSCIIAFRKHMNYVD